MKQADRSTSGADAESPTTVVSSPTADAKQLLAQQEWRGPRRFFARRRIREALASWYEESDGIPTLLGARVRFLGHQIYAARRILRSRTARFLLADEVGLGKTVEAGLVIQALCSARSDLAVLVVAPGSMSRQWLCELYLRFGARAFTEISMHAWASTSPRDRLALAAKSRIVVSTTALAASPELCANLSSRTWGLVVLDEGHHFSSDHLLYPFLEELSRKAEGFLVLSATPSMREAEGLLAMLRLISPDAYHGMDVSEFNRRLERKRAVWEALSFSIDVLGAARDAEENLDPEIRVEVAAMWEAALARDQVAEELITRFAAGSDSALEELVGYAQEFHRIDHRIIRTRRVTLSAMGSRFCTREVERVEYQATSAEVVLAQHLDTLSSVGATEIAQHALVTLYHRKFSTTPALFRQFLELRRASLARGSEDSKDASAFGTALLADPGPAEERYLVESLLETCPAVSGEAKWLKVAIGLCAAWEESEGKGLCARLQRAADWIQNHLSHHPTNKVLVFCQDHLVVAQIVSRLRGPLQGNEVVAFYDGLDEPTLQDAVLHFQKRPNCRVLVSDELGGEGRNFEFASTILHFDTPLAVGRVEQRVGRLDRVGRSPDRPVRSAVMLGPGTVEQFVVDLNEHVFRVYSASIGGLEFVLPRLQRLVIDAIVTTASFDLATQSLRDTVSATLADVQEDFQRSLDSSRREMERAEELAQTLCDAEEEEPDKDAPISRWLRVLGLEFSSNPLQIRWEVDALEEGIPGLEGAMKNVGTFRRSEALATESIQLFALGHRVIDACISRLDATSFGRATVFGRSLGKAYLRKVFLVIMAECGVSAKDGLTTGMLTRAHQLLWPEPVVEVFAIDLARGPSATLVTNPELRKRLLADYQGGQYDRKLEAIELEQVHGDLPALWAAVDDAADEALSAIATKREPLHEEAAKKLADELRYENGYYRGLAGSAEDAAVARAEIEARKHMLEAVRRASTRLDAIALVVGIE